MQEPRTKKVHVESRYHERLHRRDQVLELLKCCLHGCMYFRRLERVRTECPLIEHVARYC